jgi:hypothetical protein
MSGKDGSVTRRRRISRPSVVGRTGTVSNNYPTASAPPGRTETEMLRFVAGLEMPEEFPRIGNNR